MPIDQCLTQPSSLAVDGRKFRYPQLDSTQRMSDFGALVPKWNVFIKPLPSGFRELCGRGAERL
ncbi:hypothetical protein I79_015003 [Cricetulus griseus]|uniref:Uncharacterized protein n=1 Tax=Cricetulus griseus TaxID=10029 RepID=G3HVM5_CRIGR|nr:hypothetical protein I79_015003 [Cricetulus griseus]